MVFTNTIAMISSNHASYVKVIGNRHTDTLTGMHIFYIQTHRDTHTCTYTDTHTGIYTYSIIHTTHIGAHKVNEYITGQSLCLLTFQWYPQGNQVSSHIVE